jgi:prepilin-type N-terminal cleavage/methylation domain-containing protein
MRSGARSGRPGGFTLVELLVVITIILLVSAATLPTVLPALSQRRVGEAARILQAAIVGAHDAAIHNNRPAGIRLLGDPTLPAGTLGSNRLVAIEQAPDYTEGRVSVHSNPSQALSTKAAPTDNWPDPLAATLSAPVGYLILWQSVYNAGGTILNSPTSWYWNIRVGDKVQIGGTGRTYTVIGPMVIPIGNGDVANKIPPNPEGFVNVGGPGSSPPADPAGLGTFPEFLYLVNGQDDDNDGWIDPQWDGVNNDLANGTDFINDANEFEREKWLTDVVNNPIASAPYSIARRPVPTQGAREVMLPSGVVIDMTTGLSAVAERSILPIDPYNGTVDVMIQPNGQVIPTTLYGVPTAFGLGAAFYHFWIADREDVHAPGEVWGYGTGGAPNPNPKAAATPPQVFQLPMPQGTPGYAPTNPVFLTGERRLLTLFTRTGNLVTNSIENFDVTDVNRPFYEPQAGVREAK